MPEIMPLYGVREFWNGTLWDLVQGAVYSTPALPFILLKVKIPMHLCTHRLVIEKMVALGGGEEQGEDLGG